MSADVAYYQAVEDFFVERRGDPLFLSNADWLLVHEWKTAGIPLRVVLRGIADALESHAHSWSRARKVSRLAYCQKEVEVARERWQRALAGGGEALADPSARIAALAAALASARELPPEASRLAAETARALRARDDATSEARSLEAWLQAREAELRKALEDRAGVGALASLRDAIERELAPYASRMPGKILGQIREEAMTRRLFEAHGLPRLTLFEL